jgi:hypothetical protein
VKGDVPPGWIISREELNLIRVGINEPLKGLNIKRAGHFGIDIIVSADLRDFFPH